jgi:hypothetical protein
MPARSPARSSSSPTDAWSGKRKRQYRHVKESAMDRGESEDAAEEIAARTVNKERARRGESATASRTSTRDISSQRRAAARRRTGRGSGRTYRQLYEEAKRRNLKGRSSMDKAQLERALSR